jgi:hypothetical protein
MRFVCYDQPRVLHIFKLERLTVHESYIEMYPSFVPLNNGFVTLIFQGYFREQIISFKIR